MTIDEARSAFSSSALELARSLDCDNARVMRLLEGRGNGAGLGRKSRVLLSSHRRLLRALRMNGLDWLVAEEMEGIRSYLNLTDYPEAAEAV